MRNGKIVIFLFTLLFAAVAVVLWAFEPAVETMPLALVLNTGETEETIDCWKNETGEYYLFVPGYGDSASARLQILGRDVRIDGRPAEEVSWEDLALDVAYGFSFASREGQVHTSLTVTQSGNLPVLYIDTASGDMEHIHAKKGNQETGRMRLYTPEGEILWAGEVDALNGRGNDWMIPKKSYSLQLSGAADLLGMGQAEKWILQANAFDGSHVRNKLVYDFAGAMGLDYSPESQWVDLYLNGEYAGLYLLCERNELHDQRISLEGEGQYLVSMDVAWRLEQNNRSFLTTDAGYAFRIHNAQMDEKSLQQRLQSVENALLSETGVDPMTGRHWTELIDLDSWARKYLVEEIFGNSDGGAISQYFYGSSWDDRMYAGPVWDFDVSMGNWLVSRLQDPRTLFAANPRCWSDNPNPSWYYSLYRQEAFRERMVELYSQTCLPLLDTFLQEQLDGYLARIAEASAMNQLRWEVLHAYGMDASAEAENIRSYMTRRIAFLNQLWLEEGQFHRVLIDPQEGGFTLCVLVPSGEQIPFFLESEPSPDTLGWYVAGSQEPFDVTRPIREDLELIHRRAEPEEAPEESTGSALVRYGPFCLLLGILGTLCRMDSGRLTKADFL